MGFNSSNLYDVADEAAKESGKKVYFGINGVAFRILHRRQPCQSWLEVKHGSQWKPTDKYAGTLEAAEEGDDMSECDRCSGVYDSYALTNGLCECCYDDMCVPWGRK